MHNLHFPLLKYLVHTLVWLVYSFQGILVARGCHRFVLYRIWTIVRGHDTHGMRMPLGCRPTSRIITGNSQRAVMNALRRIKQRFHSLLAISLHSRLQMQPSLSPTRTTIIAASSADSGNVVSCLGFTLTLHEITLRCFPGPEGTYYRHRASATSLDLPTRYPKKFICQA